MALKDYLAAHRARNPGVNFIVCNEKKSSADAKKQVGTTTQVKGEQELSSISPEKKCRKKERNRRRDRKQK